ncbi:hypothetical protein CYY_009419 [Polysphondylium violaceum]|uniref:FNIP repeat-containing protein n=1 Tax=Polysphondylium violaceum TaxID=133409 RepID=A0A8J4PTQ0_9MYCE|nr:hypothetical protein CYY_009419 [Polysphondylium violaceum]
MSNTLTFFSVWRNMFIKNKILKYRKNGYSIKVVYEQPVELDIEYLDKFNYCEISIPVNSKQQLQSLVERVLIIKPDKLHLRINDTSGYDYSDKPELPNIITSLEINSLYKGLIPDNITVLTMVHLKNTVCNFDIIPKSIRYVKYINKNSREIQGKIPFGIERLDLYLSRSTPPNLSFPNSIREMKIYQLNSFEPTFILPDSLEVLELYESTIFNSLPSKLKVFKKRFNEDIVNNFSFPFPINLQEISLPLGKTTQFLPNTLSNLGALKLDHNPFQIPNNIKELKLIYTNQQALEIPHSIHTFGVQLENVDFNLDLIPSSVQSLFICFGKLNQRGVPIGSIKSSIKRIMVSGDFDINPPIPLSLLPHITDLFMLKTNITKQDLPNNADLLFLWCDSIEQHSIPSKTKELHLIGLNSTLQIQPSFFKSITSLSLSNTSLKVGDLSNNIKHLKLCNLSNDLEKGMIPDSVSHLYIDSYGQNNEIQDIGLSNNIKVCKIVQGIKSSKDLFEKFHKIEFLDFKKLDIQGRPLNNTIIEKIGSNLNHPFFNNSVLPTRTDYFQPTFSNYLFYDFPEYQGKFSYDINFFDNF